MTLRFRHLAAATTGLTFALILLGVYTAARGAGLSCSAQWPLCDGGLLPRSLPSFIEWSHRLVALLAGLLVLATAWGAWRWQDDPRVRRGATLALALFPVQALLGAGTVFAYTPAVQVAHHAGALVIFGALVATTVWAYGPTADSGDPSGPADAGDRVNADD